MNNEMETLLSDCASEDLKRVMRLNHTEAIRINMDYTDSNLGEENKKTYICDICVKTESWYIVGRVSVFNVRILKQGSRDVLFEFNQRYSKLLEIFTLLKQKYPFILMPFFPKKDPHLKYPNSDKKKMTARIKSFEHFFENILENQLFSVSSLMKLLNAYKDNDTLIKYIEGKSVQLNLEIDACQPVLENQIKFYKEMNPKFCQLEIMKNKSVQLYEYFRQLKERSKKVKFGIINEFLKGKEGFNRGGLVSENSERNLWKDAGFDCDSEGYLKVVRSLKQLARESRSIFESFEFGLKVVIKNKKIHCTQNGFKIPPCKIISEAFGWDDLPVKVQDEMFLDLKNVSYKSAVENAKEIFYEFSDQEIKEMSLMEAQLESYVKGAFADLQKLLKVLNKTN